MFKFSDKKRPSVCLLTGLSVCPFAFSLSCQLFVSLSVCLSVCRFPTMSTTTVRLSCRLHSVRQYVSLYVSFPNMIMSTVRLSLCLVSLPCRLHSVRQYVSLYVSFPNIVTTTCRLSISLYSLSRQLTARRSVYLSVCNAEVCLDRACLSSLTTTTCPWRGVSQPLPPSTGRCTGYWICRISGKKTYGSCKIRLKKRSNNIMLKLQWISLGEGEAENLIEK